MIEDLSFYRDHGGHYDEKRSWCEGCVQHRAAELGLKPETISSMWELIQFNEARRARQASLLGYAVKHRFKKEE